MSEEAENTATIEVSAPESVQESKPTREALKEAGFSKEELDLAEKHGKVEVVTKPEEKKAEAVEEVKTEPVLDERRKNTWPDMKDLTPEQLESLTKVFPVGSPQRGLVDRLKTERRMRQEERSKNQQYETRIKELEARVTPPSKEVDEAGNEIDPLDKPLTRRELQQMEEDARAQREKQQSEMSEKQARIADVLEEQEQYAMDAFPDFKRSIELATEIKQRGLALITDPTAQKLARKLFRDLQHAGMHADELTEDDLNAAEITQEIAKLHPSYGKKAANGDTAESHDGSSKPDTQANGGLRFTPEAMKRMEANTQRRASSASIPGSGGRRTVSADDVTLEDLSRMTSEKRIAFREKHPEKYAELRA